ncbi:HD-GYP domain-containing protein [Maridesulfovibrio sp.]|uniref:HD-GYP domain-containing protein n=1 Tax=Maridesulfovibrio sp. TaxID=2795000 RepID=UPI003BAB150B
MGRLKNGEHMVDVDRLRPGVYIKLVGVPWYRHPFLTSSFRIKDFKTIETLRSLGVGKVICIPDKSLVTPLEATKQKSSLRPSKLQFDTIPDDLFKEKKERMEKLKEKKESVARAEQKYSISVKQVEDLMFSITRGNMQFFEEANTLSKTLSKYFLSDCEALMHVLNLQVDKNDTVYYHSMNVTVLSLILGRTMELDEEEMRILAMGGLFHDIGKAKIEKKILHKKGKLTKFEAEVGRKHPFYGVNILSGCEDYPPEAMEIVYEHHERCCGGGYPRGLQRADLGKLTKIVAIADFYDLLINKHDPALSLTPYQALSYMFSKTAGYFEPDYLSAFIQCMGIYPPGTVVVLNDEKVGMVISVNLAKPLLPSVVIYDPEVPKKEALILDLEEESEYTITNSINPAKLAREVFDYLSPRSRMIYFVDPEFSERSKK